MRVSLVGVALGALVAIPAAAVIAFGLAPGELLASAAEGVAVSVADVGWVLLPQLVLAVGILSLALQRLSLRAAGLEAGAAPAWVDPAVESALLLGLLGTISGMVSGFVSVSPEALEPGPLVHSLGQALRSSFVGFLIALVGVWTKHRELPELAA